MTRVLLHRGKLKKVEKAEEQKSGQNSGQTRPDLDHFSPGQKMKHDGTADTGPPRGPPLDVDAETAPSRAPGDMLEADAMAPNLPQQHAQASRRLTQSHLKDDAGITPTDLPWEFV